MKIINIHFSGFGGLSGVVHGLVTAPGAEVHEWGMAYYGVVPIVQSHVDFCQERGFEYAVFRPKSKNPCLAWVKLFTWLVKKQPSAIICHSSTAIPPSFMASRLMRIPLIAVEHTPNEVKSKTEWLGSFAAMLLANRIVVLTDIYKQLLAKRLGFAFNYSKVRQITNGVSTSIYYPSAKPSSQVLRLGMAARMSASKRQDLLIDISSQLDFVLELAGDGECMPSLKKSASDQGACQVVFCGLVPESEMPKWFRGLDIYVHASSGETCSMSIIQAMASGLPIIASDISGMAEVLGADGKCGLIVPNNVVSWTNAIVQTMKDNNLRKQLGLSARQRAVDSFSTKVCLDSYISLIKEC